MPSGQASDEMAAVRSKIASLKITMKMQRAKRDKQAAWEKRDREAEKKELEMKIRSMEMETRAAQNEVRAEKKDLEQKMELMKIENEKRDRLLENERRDRKDLERNMEVMKMQAAIENEKRDRLLEKRDRLLENETRDRLLENERRDRKDLERNMEVMKMQAAHALENEKRDRMLENEKQDRDAALEKKETQHQIENEKRDRDAALEKKETQHQIENEKRDRDAAFEKKETQHQIAQLRWEARFGQMEQQLAQRTTTSPVQPVQRIVNPSPTLHGEREHSLLQQVLELKLQSNESTNPQPPLPAHAMTHAVPSVSQEGMAAPTAPISSLPAGPHAGVITGMRQGNTGTTTASQSAQPDKKSTPALPSAPLKALPSVTRPQPSSRSKQDRSVTAQSGGHASAAAPSKAVQPQHQVGIGPAAKGGSIPLPGDANNHFFLSHCQATGGDQTNAIYLELRELGFSCW
jgi:hypothetical protein